MSTARTCSPTLTSTSRIETTTPRRPFSVSPSTHAIPADPASELASTSAASPDGSSAPSLVSTSWLADNLSRVVPIDATWYLNPVANKNKVGMDDEWAFIPAQGVKKAAIVKDARKEYSERHIEGSRFFDLDEVSDHLSTLPHMLPSLEEFEEHVSAMGITENDHVVVYDTHGIFSAPRVWWTFKVFGHKNVSVLDGGLPKWLSEGRPVVSTPESHPKSQYKGEFHESMVIDYQAMLVHVTDFMYSKNFSIIDARPRDRFAGFAPEPRPTLSSGHVPSSINIPASELVDPRTKTMIPRKDILRRLFIENVDLDRPIVTMCGSGVTAATLFLALDIVGKRGDVKLFDGSWTEWASKSKSPIKKWT
ncbi:3-mercaptopyruvate sulfurtransferase [Powellomyces hirtus]|nr:3-mercaptopyruvate sulfurtransferase [Powellomyces hirtus]